MRKKIKYQGGITRLWCKWKADKNKKVFLKNLKEVEKLNIKNNKLDFEIISFSSAANFEDQILSIYSLLFYAGLR